MKPDLLERLSAADQLPDQPAPDWDAMAARIVAEPRRARRRPRRRLVLALAPVATAMAVLAGVALMPSDSAPPSVLDRAYAAATHDAIYHYVVTWRELEGPQQRPVEDAVSKREGWIDPSTGEIHEIAKNGDEFASDGKRFTNYTAFNDSIVTYDAPTAVEESPDVLGELTSSLRAGKLTDEGPETFEARRVRRFQAINAERTWRQTFLLDADTYLPVLFLHETGDHIRTGAPLADDQRVVEERFHTFERLPAETPRAVLAMRPHPTAKPGGPAPPAAAARP